MDRAPAAALLARREPAREWHLCGGPQNRPYPRALSGVALRMNAVYENPDVRLAGERRAQVEFALRNISAETWRAADGFRIGYHLLDTETGALIADGAHMRPEHDVAPGESARVQLEFELPPEDGRYQ